MHAASVEKSERLQRVLWLLLDEQWHTTMDIIDGARVCAVNSIIAELRANGLRIETRRMGRGVYAYRLVALPREAACA
ncbi:MAG: hypothetical protein K6T33_06730 [Thermomonas hydrothermalis]|uniref:hypothetical protein n=1 Tax=Thermomonas hydrothermalis TaxID=213588 RepID=UPI0023520E80|nr:hypothetical protein [Thermomonas hydrothermalis]MCL6619470.1 hypothetical protein [Thermomonas hydrothermalis]